MSNLIGHVCGTRRVNTNCCCKFNMSNLIGDVLRLHITYTRTFISLWELYFFPSLAHLYVQEFLSEVLHRGLFVKDAKQNILIKPLENIWGK